MLYIHDDVVNKNNNDRNVKLSILPLTTLPSNFMIDKVIL